MVVASKYFDATAAMMTCAELVHGDHGGCCEAAVANCTQTLAGCCRYVLPIALLPVLLKWRRLDRTALSDSLAVFGEYSLAAWIMGSGGLTMMCVMRRLLGRFTYTSVLAFPAFCSSAACAILASQRLVDMFAHGLLTLSIEVSVARGDGGLLMRAVRDSPRWRTLAFMLCNAWLLHALRGSSGQNLWIMQPVRAAVPPTKLVKFDENNNEVLSEPSAAASALSACCGKSVRETCAHHIRDEMYKYMKLGVGVEVLRTLIANARQLKVRPLQTLMRLPTLVDCDLTAFLVGYCGLYRTLNCWLANHLPHSPQLTHICAAFGAGIAFNLYPSTQLFAHAVATAIQLTWSNYLRNTRPEDRPRFVDRVSRLPIARFFYPLAFAYLMQIRIFQPWLAPPVLRNLMNQTTNYRDDYIMTRYHERLFGGLQSDAATLYVFGLDR